jgi:hypothetical protein
MKQLLVFVALSVAFLFACKNDSNPSAFMAEGQITGLDARECFCCGGWFLQTADTTFLFDRLPDGSTIDLNIAAFPIPVKFDYETDTSGCGLWLNKIILTDIEQR